MEQLRELGVALDAQSSKGYRLAAGVSALAPERIEALLPRRRARAHRVVAGRVDARVDQHPAARSAAATRRHGRGGARRAPDRRPWPSRPRLDCAAARRRASACRVAWQYPDMPADLSALSLVVGVAAVNALASLGVSGVRLKWPNDLVTAGGKLGGILIEMRAEAAGPVHLVVGVGLNVMLDEAARAAVAAMGTTADDIRAHVAPLPDRNAVVAALLARLVAGAGGISAQRSHAAPGELGRQRHAAGSRSTRREAWARSRAAWRAASTATARCWWKRPTACAASSPAR